MSAEQATAISCLNADGVWLAPSRLHGAGGGAPLSGERLTHCGTIARAPAMSSAPEDFRAEMKACRWNNVHTSRSSKPNQASVALNGAARCGG